VDVVTLLMNRIAYFAAQPTTAVSLRELFEIGLSRSRRLAHAQFIQRELPIRLSQRVMELHSLPFSLDRTPGIADIASWYGGYAKQISQHSQPKDLLQERHFTRLLERIFEDHSEVIVTMSMGVKSLMVEVGQEEYEERYQAQVEEMLNRFFMARIGIRFLTQHHIESQRNRPHHSGIINSQCSAMEIARIAAQDAMRVCEFSLGCAPKVEIGSMDEQARFAYIPMHLQYMLLEILKNACRASVETHGAHSPPVQVWVVHGDEDVTIKVSDRGGGIPRSDLPRVWRYMHSTFRGADGPAWRPRTSHPRPADSVANPLQRGGAAGSRVAGYGVGLPLSRLYARYFGGDLELKSMEGFGTDAYLHLNRLGSNCEQLPSRVQVSPAERDSSWTGVEEGDSQITSEEETFLKEQLRAFRERRRAEP